MLYISGENVPVPVQDHALVLGVEKQKEHVIRKGAGAVGPSPLRPARDPDLSPHQGLAAEKSEDVLGRVPHVVCLPTAENDGHLTDAVGLHLLEDGLRPDEDHPLAEGIPLK